jgi:streptomycin 6-kinase
MTVVERWSLPQNLVVTNEGDGLAAWISTLPERVRMLAERWSLRVGEPFQPGGRTAWVAPARSSAGADLVLKVAWRHSEADNEAHALTLWDGDGAVRLQATEEWNDTNALLLERCVPGTGLSSRPESEQDPVVAELLRRLWIAPPSNHRFRPLHVMCDAWADEFERKLQPGHMDLDAGLVSEGIALFRQLPVTADRSVLLCTDLHAGNVLAAERRAWLAIDPKPYVGDPAYDLVQHLVNCDTRLHADPRAVVSRVADLAEMDGDRVLLWLFARCVLESPGSPGLVEVARTIAPG